MYTLKYQRIVSIFLCSTTILASQPLLAGNKMSSRIIEDGMQDLDPLYHSNLKYPQATGDDLVEPFYGPLSEKNANFPSESNKIGLVGKIIQFERGAHTLRVLMEEQEQIIDAALKNTVISLRSISNIRSTFAESLNNVLRSFFGNKEWIRLLALDSDDDDKLALLDKLSCNIIANLNKKALKKLEGKEAELIGSLKLEIDKVLSKISHDA